MSDTLGNAIMKEMTLKALQVATLQAAIRRLDDQLACGDPGDDTGLEVAVSIVRTLINEIQAQ